MNIVAATKTYSRLLRSYECFKYLHLGIISPLKRKSLPEIAKVTGINSAQSLDHFLAQSPWSVIEIRERRLSKTLLALNGFRQCKQESCWTDYRLTLFEQIEKWWEVIMSAYLMISLNSKIFEELNQSQLPSDDEPTDFSCHQQWNLTGGWKSAPPALRFPQRIGRSKQYFE
jgi:hypothetical protein